MIQLEKFVGGGGRGVLVGWWLTPTTYIQLAGAGSTSLLFCLGNFLSVKLNCFLSINFPESGKKMDTFLTKFHNLIFSISSVWTVCNNQYFETLRKCFIVLFGSVSLVFCLNAKKGFIEQRAFFLRGCSSFHTSKYRFANMVEYFNYFLKILGG